MHRKQNRGANKTKGKYYKTQKYNNTVQQNLEYKQAAITNKTVKNVAVLFAETEKKRRRSKE